MATPVKKLAENETETPVPQVRATTTVAEALTIWKRAAEHEQLGMPVVDEKGDIIADLFFSDPGFSRELSGAKEVQQRLLPHTVPTVPNFSFAGRYAPAGHVGGDYWSVKYYPDEDIVTCKLADVTGHGIASAILVAAIKFVSGVLFRYSPSPAAVMERTNHSLLRETSPDRMATMVYAWLYPPTRRVRLVNAGHAPAFIVQGDTGVVRDIPVTGPLLGLMESTYEEFEMILRPGDILIFCSDGVAEAGDPTRFGEDRVKEIVQGCRHQSADTIADTLFTAALTCCGPVRDDMSLLVIKATAGPSAPSMDD